MQVLAKRTEKKENTQIKNAISSKDFTQNVVSLAISCQALIGLMELDFKIENYAYGIQNNLTARKFSNNIV